MLLDYATQEKRAPQDGVQVAGLLDLAKLLEYIGNPATAKTIATMKGGVKAAPEQFYQENGLFLDPRGRLTKDTGPTYVGRPLPEQPTLAGVLENGPTLEDYLQGTEAGDIFGRDFRNIKVGVTKLPSRYDAGFTGPKGFTAADGTYQVSEPGYLVINNKIPPEKRGALFEHEMEHGYQDVLGMPRGTNQDEMSNDMVSYLIQAGLMRPAQAARIDAAAAAQGASKPYMRYSSAMGEAAARASEARYRAMEQGYDVGIPREAEYTWTHDGPQISRDMLFDIPQDTEQAFKLWWKNKWK